jgi:glutamyl-tRNA(Gln) amidotransferase subunit D
MVGALIKKAKSGDLVLVKTKEMQEEGILIPSPKDNILMIKLDSGYNIGFEKKKLLEFKILKTSKKTNQPSQKITQNKSLPTISVLHTGGTIASKVDYRTGAVASEFGPEELLALFPELKDIANIKSELVAQMWSDDLRFSHFTLLAKAIEKHVKLGVDGIIVGMGTDNLAVGSAAINFMVESCPIPIIFVGAQRSSDRGSSDAGVNLICAADFIAKTNFGGVAICMHESSNDDACTILPATKTYKLHSSRRDAFKAINSSPIARVCYEERKTIFLRDYPKRNKDNKLIIKSKMQDKVALLKIHVNMFPEQFSFFKEQEFKGLIIEGTGLGHTPGQVPNDLTKIHKKIYPAIKDLVKSGCVVVMTTQCMFGQTNLNVYDKGRDLLELGVISGKDMLANTALVKLSWLLGNFNQEETKKLISQNLRGEFNETLLYEEFEDEIIEQ